MFNKAATTRAFEDIVQQIRAAIVDGRLKQGDRLPPQRELKEMFQVSRATVMEAIRVLEMADLITIRPGSTGGAFVSHATSDTVADSLLLLLHLKGVSLEELAEFRERVEGGTAYWAASRADETALATLEDCVRRLRDLAKAKTAWSDFLAEEMKVHWLIAEYSRNRPSVATMQAIIRAMREAYAFISPGLYEKVISDIQGIVDAIRLRDPIMAEDRMKSHIAYFNDDMMANRRALTSEKKKRPRATRPARQYPSAPGEPWPPAAPPPGSGDSVSPSARQTRSRKSQDPGDRVVTNDPLAMN